MIYEKTRNCESAALLSSLLIGPFICNSLLELCAVTVAKWAAHIFAAELHI